MKTSHLIDSAIFDIGFSSEDTAFEQQSEINTFINNELMAVVSEVFDMSSNDSTLLRIPLLDLDLGIVSHADYRDELPRRLRAKLTEWLSDNRESLSSELTVNNRCLDSHTSRRELVEYFMLYGFLPWYASLDQDETVEDVFNQVLDSTPQAVRLFFQTTQNKQQVVDRLVSQFTQKTIYRVVQLLSPNHIGELKQISSLFLMLCESRLIENINSVKTGRLVLSSLIFVLLSKGSRQLSAEQLFEQVLLSILPKLVVGTGGFLNKLEKLSDNSLNKATLISIFTRLQEKQYNDSAPNFSDDVINSASTKPDRLVRLTQIRQQLLYAVVTGDFLTIKVFWSEILNDYSQLLEETLRYHGQKEEVRKLISLGFPVPVLQQILAVLEPSESDFIINVIDKSELFQVNSEKSVPEKTGFSRQLWQFSLGYLVVERGSHFNKKSYMTSLVRQMARANSISHVEMLAALTAHVNTMSSPNSTSRQLLQFLLELGGDNKTYRNNEELSSLDQPPLYEPYEAYDQLSLALNHGGDISENCLAKVIDRVVSQDDILLMRLLRELQCARFALDFSVTALTADHIRRLVFAFIRVMNKHDSPNQSDFTKAIETYSKQSKSLKSYYNQILQCLLNDELIDFETILSKSTAALGVPEINPLSTPIQQQLKVDANAEQRLLEYLYDDQSISKPKKDSLIHAFEHLVKHSPQELQRILFELITDKKMIVRLVSVIPERQLCISLSLMGMSNQQRLQQYAEIITTACYRNSLKISVNQLIRFKWQLLFSYLNDVGSVFNENGFIEYFITGLLNLVDLDWRSNSQKTISPVYKQLKDNSLPSTHEMTQRVIRMMDDITGNPIKEKTNPCQLVTESDQGDSVEELPIDDIHILNAGVVLAAPYLQRLFEMLGLIEKSAFKSEQTSVRAVHMLQYLVNTKTNCPEHQLVLNKLLCGVKPTTPIIREISLNPDEEQHLEGLLLGMIQNWKSIGNTTVPGLRESFLQRQGRLQLKDDAWHLLVESKPYDMLLDQLPWSYSTIKYPWMERVIYVEWR